MDRCCASTADVFADNERHKPEKLTGGTGKIEAALFFQASSPVEPGKNGLFQAGNVNGIQIIKRLNRRV